MADNITVKNSAGVDTTVRTTDTAGVHTPHHIVENLNDAIKTDDAAFTPATTKVVMAGFEFDDTTPDAVDEGDAGAARMSSRREVYVQIRDAAGNERGLNVDASNRIAVTVGSLPASTNTIEVVGDAAHDAVIAGNPVRIGGHARNADITSVANGDTANFITDLQGKQVVMPFAVPDLLWQGVTAAITGTSDTAVKAAAGVGVRNYVTSLTVINSHASVDTVVEIKDGTTVIHRGFAKSGGGGYTITFPTPLKGTANTAINAACLTTGANVYVSASGYTAP